MAVTEIFGPSSGALLDFEATGGSGISIVTTPIKNNPFSLRINPSGDNAWTQTSARSAQGGWALGNGTSIHGVKVDIRFASLPNANGTPIFWWHRWLGTEVVAQVRVDTNGDIYLHNGTSASGVAGTLSTNTWYRLEFRVQKNAQGGIRIDGGTEQTLTCGNFDTNYLIIGSRYATATYDLYLTEFVDVDTGYPGPLAVKPLHPNGAGAFTEWTSGTASTFDAVDEDSHDGDDTYIGGGAAGDESTFQLESCSAAGIAGAIISVRGFSVARRTAGSANNLQTRLRSGSTNLDTTNMDSGATYTMRVVTSDTDPATPGGAWTIAAVDAIEVGVELNTAQASRCTQVGALVVYFPSTAAAKRFSLPSSGAPSISPAFGSAWTQPASGTDRIALPSTPGSSALTDLTITGTTAVAVETVMSRQYVSDSLDAQFLAGYITGVIRGLESNAGLNATVAVNVRLVSSTGTHIADLVPLTASDSTATPPEFGTSAATRRLQNVSEAVAIPIVPRYCATGDRLVIEFGFRKNNTTGSRTCTLRFGENGGSDFAHSDGLTTDLNPWIEFSLSPFGSEPQDITKQSSINVGISAVAARSQVLTRGLSVAIAHSSAATRTQEFPRPQSLSVTHSAVLARAQVLTRAQAAAAAHNAAVVRIAERTRAASMSAAHSAAMARSLTLLRSQASPVGITLSLARLLSETRPAAISVSASASLVRSGQFSRPRSLSVTNSTTLQFTKSALRSAALSAAHSAALSRNLVLARALNLSAAQSSQLSRVQGVTRASSSTVNHAATLVRSQTLTRTATASISSVATLARIGNRMRSASMGVAHAATLVRSQVLVRAQSLSVAVGTTLARLKESLRVQSISVGSSITLARFQVLTRTLSITAAHSATLAYTAGKTMVSSVSVGSSTVLQRLFTGSRSQVASTPHSATVATTADRTRSAASAIPSSTTLARAQTVARESMVAVAVVTLLSRLQESLQQLAASIASTITLDRTVEQGDGGVRQSGVSIPHSALVARLTELTRTTVAATSSNAAVSRIQESSRTLVHTVAAATTLVRTAVMRRESTSGSPISAILARTSALARASLSTGSLSTILSRSQTLSRTLAVSLAHSAALVRSAPVTRVLTLSVAHVATLVRERSALRGGLLAIASVTTLARTQVLTRVRSWVQGIVTQLSFSWRPFALPGDATLDEQPLASTMVEESALSSTDVVEQPLGIAQMDEEPI